MDIKNGTVNDTKSDVKKVKIIDFGGEASTLWSRNQKNPGFGGSEGCYDKKIRKSLLQKHQKIAPKNEFKNNLKMI